MNTKRHTTFYEQYIKKSLKIPKGGNQNL